MEKLLMTMLEEAKKSKRAIRSLKLAAINAQCYELAAKLREIERESFPETPEQTEAKLYASNLGTAFRMIELNIKPDSVVWLIGKTVKLFHQKKGKFSLKDASELLALKFQLFEYIENGTDAH